MLLRAPPKTHVQERWGRLGFGIAYLIRTRGNQSRILTSVPTVWKPPNASFLPYAGCSDTITNRHQWNSGPVIWDVIAGGLRRISTDSSLLPTRQMSKGDRQDYIDLRTSHERWPWRGSVPRTLWSLARRGTLCLNYHSSQSVRTATMTSCGPRLMLGLLWQPSSIAACRSWDSAEWAASSIRHEWGTCSRTRWGATTWRIFSSMR